MLPQKTAKFEDYTACAGPYCEPWRTALGVLIVAAVYAGGGYLLVMLAIKIAENIQLGAGYAMVFELATSSSKRAVLIALFSAVLMLPGLWLVLRFLHHRSLRSVIAPTGRIHWGNYTRAMLFILVFAGVTSIPVLLNAEFTQQLSLSQWLPWLAPALLLIFLQTATEELVFRGYLMQQLAARFHSRWVWWVLPAAIFGAVHYNTLTYGDNAWLVVFSAFLTGLIFGDITARSGDLSIALGLHFANNLTVILLLGVPGQLSSLSLFLQKLNIRDVDVMRAEILASTSIMLAIYFVYLLVMRARR
ncbi:MAG TPA: CPBP family intramembrane metalloprotease [Rhodobacteraceae bacterium]|nr:CPBP family intramembrane metalloprotease [Paracoccaceae bacterium]